jgi:uncharacterized membrane-anchored protein
MNVARRMANRVPEVTVYFWIIEVLATTVSETAADLLNMNARHRRRGPARRADQRRLPAVGWHLRRVIALIAFGYRMGMLGAVLAFWAAYVLTRPLGASLGDRLSQSRDDGGLGLGTVGPSVVFLLASVVLVVHLTRGRVDAPQERLVQPAPANARTYP